MAERNAVLENNQLGNFLKEKLPEYMIPTFYLQLSQLPLTTNGKIDRRSLPAIERPQGSGASTEPHTWIEELLAGVWADLLGVARVEAEDNFFELGGTRCSLSN